MSTEEFLLSLTVSPVLYQPGGATVPQIRSLQSKIYQNGSIERELNEN
jgi:hypothetical protein